MKLILLVAIAFACIDVQVWANEDEEALMQAASAKCKEGVSEEELEQLNNGEFDDGNHGDKNIRCFVKCVMNELGSFDGDVLKEDVFMEYFEPHLDGPKAKEFYDLCKGEVGDGECETPFKIVMCLRRSDDVFKFLQIYSI